MHWDGGWGGWILMSTFTLVVWGLLVYAVVLGVRALTHSERTWPHSSAEHILEERLARGEIDLQEFEDRRRVLTQSPPLDGSSGAT